MQELTAQLTAYAAEKRKSYNIIEDAEITAKGNFHQGNKGGAASNDADDKNTIKRTKINIEGDFRQGDDIEK